MDLQRMTTLLAPKTALGLGFLVSAALLAGAHSFERFGQLPPCLLCLEQREIHWLVLIAAGLGVALTQFLHHRLLTLLALLAVTALFLWSTGLAGYHAGVEWDFWEGPSSCAAGNPSLEMSADDLLSSIGGASLQGPPCEEAMWRMFGISMAGYNALISLAMAMLSGAAAWRLARRA